MNFFRSFVGIKAQLLYSLVLVVFIVGASTYLFSITSVEQTFFGVRTQILATVMIIKNIKLPQPKIVENAYAPTHTAPSSTPTPTEPPSPATVENPDSQLVNCTGPDDHTLWLTQKDCDNFNDAWKGIPTPTTSATSSAFIN